MGGILKASTNRIRTSEALRMNNIWENTIGLQNEHNNKAVENRLNNGLLAHVRGIKNKHDNKATYSSKISKNSFAKNTKNLENLLDITRKQYEENFSNTPRGTCKNYLAKYFEETKQVTDTPLSSDITLQNRSNLNS